MKNPLQLLHNHGQSVWLDYLRPLTLDLYLPPSALEWPASGFPLVNSVYSGLSTGRDLERSGQRLLDLGGGASIKIAK